MVLVLSRRRLSYNHFFVNKGIIALKQRILILGHNAATQFIDIYNQYTRLFDTNKFIVTVAYLTGAPDQKVIARTLAEEVLFLNIPKKKLRTLKIGAIKQLLALCREKNFHIVICHRYKPTYIMLWVSQFHRIPACLFVMHELKTMSSIGRRCLMALLFRKNMLLAGVSCAVRDDMRKNLWFISQDRMITLYNMIDIALTEPLFLSKTEARNQLQLPHDAFIFGHIARLVPNKDQHTLIQAFARIKKSLHNTKLIIIGNGQLETQLKEEVNQLGLQEDILFTGYLTQAFRYMKAFDCFVLSSVQEAFGRVLLEAMIAKLPIIATRTHGIPEVLGNSGMIVNPSNPMQLADAMLKHYHMSHHDLIEYGQKAYQHTLNHFSIPCFQKEFWQLPLIANLKKITRTL